MHNLSPAELRIKQTRFTYDGSVYEHESQKTYRQFEDDLLRKERRLQRQGQLELEELKARARHPRYDS